MKIRKILALLLCAALTASLFAGCGSSGQPAPEAPAATESPTADAGKLLKTAEKRIEEAGADIELWTEALAPLAEQAVEAARDPQTAAFLLSSGKRFYNTVKLEMESIYNADAVQTAVDLLAQLTAFDPSVLEEAGREELSRLILDIGFLYSDMEQPDRMLDYWKKTKDDTVALLLEVMDLYSAGRNVEALTLLRQKLPDNRDHDSWTFSMAATAADESLGSMLDLWKAYAMIQNIPADSGGAWMQELTEYWKGTIDGAGSAPLTQADLDALSRAGEGAGKILILDRKRPYGEAEAQITLSSRNLDLPEALFPAAPEEISYILLVDTDYEETGQTFNVGTVLIKEHSTVSVWAPGGSKPLHQSDTESTYILPSVTLTYNGDPPVYYAPNHPEIQEAGLEALEYILENIN